MSEMVESLSSELKKQIDDFRPRLSCEMSGTSWKPGMGSRVYLVFPMFAHKNWCSSKMV